MNFKRLFTTFRLCTVRGGAKGRAEYLRKARVFAEMGENCTIMQRRVPLYPNLISLGSNVHTASNVNFVPHDVTHQMLNQYITDEGIGKPPIREKLGCIKVGDNVFIGAGTMILSNVQIGSNVIIGAGSLVNKDIPDNSVAAGVPARVIGSFQDFFNKRLAEESYPENMKDEGETLSEELARWLWKDFEEKRSKAPE